MAQEYISVMDKIKRSHAMVNALPCMQFDYSVNKYLGFWYAEERLYVIHDCTVDAYYFEKAENPIDAIYRVLKRIDAANDAFKSSREVGNVNI